MQFGPPDILYQAHGDIVACLVHGHGVRVLKMASSADGLRQNDEYGMLNSPLFDPLPAQSTEPWKIGTRSELIFGTLQYYSVRFD